MSVKFSKTESSLVISRSLRTCGPAPRSLVCPPSFWELVMARTSAPRPELSRKLTLRKSTRRLTLPSSSSRVTVLLKRDSDSPMTRSPSTVRIVTWPSSVVVSCMKAGRLCRKVAARSMPAFSRGKAPGGCPGGKATRRAKASRPSNQDGGLQVPGEQQDDDDQNDQTQGAARPVAPAPAVRPGRDGSEKQHDEDDKQDQAHSSLLSSNATFPVCLLARTVPTGPSLTARRLAFFTALLSQFAAPRS